ncbi:MAG: hypothetical protein MSS96_03045 [Bacteroidales bacterium]|nr:hypothetical protein [Bacteroidales bacterium]
MVTLGDFNYAYVAGRLLDGENGDDMYSVVCDIRSMADLLGTTPVDDMMRKIPVDLEELGREDFRKNCADLRKIVCNRLDRKDYDLLEMFCHDWENYKEEMEDESEENGLSIDDLWTLNP